MKEQSKILVIDDNEMNRNVLADLLATQGYDVFQAVDGADGLEKIDVISPDVILLDVNMPKIDGLEVARRIKEDDIKKFIPIIMITGLSDIQVRLEALKLGVDDFLSKPPHAAELIARVRSLVKVKAYNDYMQNNQRELEAQVAERTRQLNETLQELKQSHDELRRSSLDTVYRLARASEYKDEDTSVHLQRMSHYAEALARKTDLDDTAVETILYASPMHDVGKIGIPDKILLKQGNLTPHEWDIMRQHTLFGAQILEGSASDYINLAEVIAITHHEKWDGSGYPNGLKGLEIPMVGRITAIADVFDALTSRRPYKEAFPLDKALSIIEEGRGTHFDPQLVDDFLEIEYEIVSIKDNYSDRGESLFLDLAEKTG